VESGAARNEFPDHAGLIEEMLEVVENQKKRPVAEPLD